MNQKISRNKKHKYSKEKKLALGEEENTSALINIAQEDDSNIFVLLQNLCTIFHLSSWNVLDFVYLFLLFLFYFYCIPKSS